MGNILREMLREDGTRSTKEAGLPLLTTEEAKLWESDGVEGPSSRGEGKDGTGSLLHDGGRLSLLDRTI